MSWNVYPNSTYCPHLSQGHIIEKGCNVTATTSSTKFGVIVFYQCQKCQQFWSVYRKAKVLDFDSPFYYDMSHEYDF